MSPKLILEVAPDVAVENTIILTVPRSGLGQPFPGAESGADGAEARSSSSRARAASRCLLGSPNVFLIINVINDYFSKTTKVSKIKSHSSHNPSLWCVGFHNSSGYK